MNNRTSFFSIFLLFVFTGMFFFFLGCTGITRTQKQYIEQQIARAEQILNQINQAEERIKKIMKKTEAAQRQTALTAERMKVMMNYLERKLKEIQDQYFELESLIVSTQSSIKKNSKK